MKYVVLLPDGAADEPVEELGGLTPLEKAATPNMDRLAREGKCGTQQPIPEGMEAGSEVGNLSVLGYDPAVHLRDSGRGPIEAASLGIDLAEEESALRMNLVRVGSDGRMLDHSAGHITTEQARPIVEALSAALADEFSEFRICTGKGYRHLAITSLPLEGMTYSPPHSIVGEPVADHLPRGGQQARLRELLAKASLVLQDLEINTARGDTAATDIWLWGAGKKLSLPLFVDEYGLNGGMVTAVDLPKGLAKLVGMSVEDIPGATGFTDTDYSAKVSAALDILEEKDLVYLHVEAPDEMGHASDRQGKIEAIEAFDSRVVGPILAGLERYDKKRILLTCDHLTPVAIGDHRAGAVPYVLWGTGITADGVQAFSEKECAAKGKDAGAGHLLMSKLIGI